MTGVRIGAGACGLVLLLGCQEVIPSFGGPGNDGRQPEPAYEEGRLSARPREPAKRFMKRGLLRLPFDDVKESLLYVPPSYRPGRAAPVAVVLHGAGGGGGGIRLFRSHADRLGLVLVAPRSRDRSWDVIYGGYGSDVAFIDRTLRWVFERFAVDRDHLAIGGFSDGASYALTLGRLNGDLFTHVLGFSPGFLGPGEARGDPAIFITHGTQDGTLPIDRTSRELVPELWAEGFDVRYVEFAGKHEVPPEVEAQALRWFLE